MQRKSGRRGDSIGAVSIVVASAGITLGTLASQTAGAELGQTRGETPASGREQRLGNAPAAAHFAASSLHLRTATVDTSAGFGPAAPGGAGGGIERLLTDFGPVGGKHFVIQLAGPMSKAWRQRLEAAGVVIGDYLPENAFIVRLDAADAQLFSALDFVTWGRPFAGAWKIDPMIGKRLVPFATEERQEIEARGEVVVDINLFRGAAVADVLPLVQAIAGAQIHMIYDISGASVITASLPAASVALLAGIENVQFVEETSEVTLRDDAQNAIVQSGTTSLTPIYNQGLRGQGQVVAVIDSRVNINHCSFSDSNPIGPNHRKILAYNGTTGSSQHGTHVAGIAVGDNAGSNLRGVANLAKLVYGGTTPSFTGTAFTSRLNYCYDNTARIVTNSWGNDGTTAYDNLARQIDDFSRVREDMVIMFAVTNTASLRNPENAKSCLSVGAISKTNPNAFCSGGAGPTSDGRRKPEVFAPGCSIIAASSGSSCGSVGLTGTSMASPAVAGATALLRQYFVDGWYPTGSPVPSNSLIPSGALMRAVILNGSVDATGFGSGYPSTAEGWGRVVLDNPLAFASDARKVIVWDVRNNSQESLSTGESLTFNFNVTASQEQLRVTMTFTDVPAAAGASLAPVNNLNLEVIAPGGAIYRGNFFSGGASAPDGVFDALNSTEQVHVNSPAIGTWTVRVIGTAVNQQTQGFALVATGQVEAAGAPEPCLADLNGDGSVGSADLGVLLGAWGTPGCSGASPCPADLNNDGSVGSADLGALLGTWGACP